MPQKRRRHSRPLAKIGASALSLLLVASMWPGIGFADDVQAGGSNPADRRTPSKKQRQASPPPLERSPFPKTHSDTTAKSA